MAFNVFETPESVLKPKYENGYLFKFVLPLCVVLKIIHQEASRQELCSLALLFVFVYVHFDFMVGSVFHLDV